MGIETRAALMETEAITQAEAILELGDETPDDGITDRPA
jgi:hypothetical protein